MSYHSEDIVHDSLKIGRRASDVLHGCHREPVFAAVVVVTLLLVATPTSKVTLVTGFNELDIRFECGYTKPTNHIYLSDREKILKVVWLHYVYFVPHAELQQLRKGFRETLQLETLIYLHPEEMHSFLVASSNYDVTSDYLLDSFAIQYSEAGSNKRTVEESVILSWTDYISDCEGG